MYFEANRMDEKKMFQPSPMLLETDPLVLTTGLFKPGEAEAFCERIENETRRAQAKAELRYFQGEAQTANALFREIADKAGDDDLPAAILGTVMTSLAGGDPRDVIRIYEFAKSLENDRSSAELSRISSALLLYFNMLLHNLSAIRIPTLGPDAFAVPRSIRPMAIYVYTGFLLSKGDVGRAIGLAEGALVFMDRPCPVSEIYLALIVSRGYMLKKEWDKAEYYFHYAWSRAKPDGLYMPFAEHRGMLSGMLEKCLRYEEPQAYKRISELSGAYQKRWVFVHNALTGDEISDALTAIEYNVASLASKGLSNAEIADFLGIAVNSVRAHLRNIFNKLNIGNRKELAKYVL